MLRGLTAVQIGEMTKYQVFQAIAEIDQDWMMRARLSGCEVKEEEEVKEMTVQDLFSLGGFG